MKQIDFPHLREQLEIRIRARTGRRVRNLDIQLSPDGVTLQGMTVTFYDKQLAQHSIRELLPDVRLNNAIVVG